MQKNIMLLLVIVLTFSLSVITAQVSDTKRETSTKTIKTIEYYNIDVKTGEKMHAATDYFDKKGNKTKSLNYDAGEEIYLLNIFTQTVYTYNKNGILTASTTTDAEGNTTHFIKNKYDGNLKMEETTIYQKTVFQYNSNGDVTLKEEYDLSGEFKKGKKRDYEYVDETTMPQKVIVSKKYGEGDFKNYAEETYAYNENGKLKQKTIRASFYEYHYGYQYHTNGNVSTSLIITHENEKTIKKHNENGQPTSEEIFRKEGPDFPFELDWTNTWTYDEHGNEVMSESIQKEKVLRKKIRVITYYE